MLLPLVVFSFYCMFFGVSLLLKNSEAYLFSIFFVYGSLLLDYYFFKIKKLEINPSVFSKLKANFKITFVLRQIVVFSILVSSKYFENPAVYLIIIAVQQIAFVLVQMPIEIIPKMNLPFAVKNIKSNAKYIKFIKGGHELKLKLMNFVLMTELCFLMALIIKDKFKVDLLIEMISVASIICISLIVFSFYIYNRVENKISSGEYLEQLFDWIENQRFHSVVHFSGNAQSTYQLNTWLNTLEKLEKKVLIIVREKHHTAKITSTKLPIIYVKRLADLESVIFPTVKIAYYVANVGPNLHLLRNFRLKHVFLGHGDSDKVSSMNNFSRVYNKIYVAGNAAIERYKYAGVDIEEKAFSIVGRPQLDCVLEDNKINDDKSFCVLYAPTWEGYFRDSDYSSIISMSESFIKSLANSKQKIKIMFKPHPLTGSVLPEAKLAMEEVKKMIKTHMENYEIVTTNRKNIFDCFNESDVLLTDVSSVMSDYLKSNKPLLLTDPKQLGKENLNTKFPVSKAAYILSPNDDLAKVIGDIKNNDYMSAERKKVKVHTLGIDSGNAFELFNKSVDSLYNEAIEQSGDFVKGEAYGLFEGEIKSLTTNNGGGSEKGCLWIKSNYGIYRKGYFEAGDVLVIHAIDYTKRFKGKVTSEDLKPGIYIVQEAEYNIKELDFALKIREQSSNECFTGVIAGNAIEFSIVSQANVVKFGPDENIPDVEVIIDNQIKLNRSYLAKQKSNMGGSAKGALWIKSSYGIYDQDYIKKYDQLYIEFVGYKGNFKGKPTDRRISKGAYFVSSARYSLVDSGYQVFINHGIKEDLCVAKGDIEFSIDGKMGLI